MNTEVTNIQVGSKVWFPEFKRPYTVKAFDARFAICTQPFNLNKTVLYTICDFKERIRGTNNLVFNMYNYADQKDIDECLKDLNDKDDCVEISYRNRVSLNITKIENDNPQ